ncbi:MAG: SpoIIE family protein phosphatase [Bacteroidetes bacterium]|nr:SpoIIE family protein phosphatase [Bacteroidota bacterium]
MEKKHIPVYHGFRVYFFSNLLYSFLIIPFLIFLGAKSIPEMAKDRGYMHRDAKSLVDSLVTLTDSMEIYTGESFDSLLNSAVLLGEEFIDSIAEEKKGASIVVLGPDSEEDDDNLKLFNNKGPFSRFFRLLFLLTLASYIAGLIYNNPFKRYFKKTRSKKEVSDNLQRYCKRQLLRTPVINALIITLPSALVILYSLFFILLRDHVEMEMEREMFREFFFLALLATILEFLFVFYWQKHRVHIRYIEYFYSKEELKKKVFKRKGGRIRDRLMMASGMTTTLPLLIVLVYLIQSLTMVRSMKLDTISEEAWNILVGPWGDMINAGKDTFSVDKLEWMIYVNAVDTLSMIIGISMGILVSLLYLILFIRWTNQEITYPVMELLKNIRNTRAGETEQYTIVRTNDEIGELTEGYNEMTRKIHEHVERISRMNRDLEKTVEERTHEVVMQKEEIEAQKEEIETQLDMATQQRDTISWQNEQILDSIRYAERIQSAILPPEKNFSEVLSQQFILFKPRDIVSGDYYWTAMKNGKLLIAAADCTGHGVPGAFLSVMGISSLNEIVSRRQLLKAGEILEELRTYVVRSLHQTGLQEEARDGIEIALCIIDLKKGIVEFAGANRPLYLVREKSVIQYKGDRMPIGIYDQELAPFTSQTIKLQKNDSVYLFSDGYVDQLGGPNRKTFRVIRFRKLLIEIQDKPMDEQKRILMEQHESWKGPVEQIDDILVVGFRL